MILIECTQGTPEWHEARLGVITASRARDACDKLKSGQPSKSALALAAQLAMETVAQVSCDDTYVNFAMKRGQDLEPHGRMAYEATTGNLVQESGIVLTDDRRMGYSTDGFVDAKGVIEIKCPNSPLVVVNMWKTQDLSDYMHQMQMGLWITGRHWIDFVMYDPRLEPVGKDLFIRRVERDEAFIEKMELDLLAFMRLVDENVAALRSEIA